MDQPKIERMIRLLLMLSGNINYCIDELAETLDMSSRTIYRYIDTFRAAGLSVKKLYSNTYKIEKVPQEWPEFDRLLYFSEEEATLIHSVIEAVVPTNSLKKGIKKKLAVVYDSTAIENFVDYRSNAGHIETLKKAAQEKKKVILKDYESGNSRTIRDRYAEPYGFTTDFIDVCAFDLEDGKNKIFKINRIGTVEKLDEDWTAEKSHKRQGMDVFRMAGPAVMHIKWKMSVMAKNLLLEEYPLAEKAIKRSGNFWVLDTDLSSPVGACRFFLGLSNEIKIVEGEEFLEYVKDFAKKNIEKL